jgi:hypothetical protein
MNRFGFIAVMATGLALANALPASAREYRFHVSCPDKALVVEWGIGDIDPGQEYLRVTTGTKYPGCSVTDYDAARDATLPMEQHSAAGGFVAGIPLLGPILSHIFGF